MRIGVHGGEACGVLCIYVREDCAERRVVGCDGRIAIVSRLAARSARLLCCERFCVGRSGRKREFGQINLVNRRFQRVLFRTQATLRKK